MDHGQIVEQGKHEYLLAIDGIYASLWRVSIYSQLMEFMPVCGAYSLEFIRWNLCQSVARTVWNLLILAFNHF